MVSFVTTYINLLIFALVRCSSADTNQASGRHYTVVWRRLWGSYAESVLGKPRRGRKLVTWICGGKVKRGKACRMTSFAPRHGIDPIKRLGTWRRRPSS